MIYSEWFSSGSAYALAASTANLFYKKHAYGVNVIESIEQGIASSFPNQGCGDNLIHTCNSNIGHVYMTLWYRKGNVNTAYPLKYYLYSTNNPIANSDTVDLSSWYLLSANSYTCPVSTGYPTFKFLSSVDVTLNNAAYKRHQALFVTLSTPPALSGYNSRNKIILDKHTYSDGIA